MRFILSNNKDFLRNDYVIHLPKRGFDVLEYTRDEKTLSGKIQWKPYSHARVADHDCKAAKHFSIYYYEPRLVG